jgi:hypothetical protein
MAHPFVVGVLKILAVLRFRRVSAAYNSLNDNKVT